MRRVRLAALAALVVAAVTLTSTPARSALVELPGRIAFMQNHGHLATINDDGSFHLDLGIGGGPPSWSADGTRIGFGTAKDLPDYPVVASGFSTVSLLGLVRHHYAFNGNGAYGARWSPDGTRLAYDRWTNDDGHRVYVSDLDGADETMLEPTGRPDRNSGPDHNPRWSPDGTRIVYEQHTSYTSRIWIMNADGTNAHEVPNVPAGGARNPSFAPDGKRIVFISDPTNAHHFGQVFIVGADGSNPHAVGRADRYLQHPAMSPDGKKIAYSDSGASYTHDAASGIYVMHADGSNVRRVTDKPAHYPAWQPRQPLIASSTNAKPTAAITAQKLAQFPQTIVVSGATSSDADGSIATYEWHWGDKSVAQTGRWQWHSFARRGTYYVSLVVTDNKGAKAIKTVRVTI